MLHTIRPAVLVAAGVIVLTLAASPAKAVPESAFAVQNTAQLLQLCTTPRTDPSYVQAMQFCHGFAAGALSYHRAQARPGTGAQYCNLPAARQEAMERFVSWAQGRPQLMDDNPANTLFRFLDANYRCAGRTGQTR